MTRVAYGIGNRESTMVACRDFRHTMKWCDVGVRLQTVTDTATGIVGLLTQWLRVRCHRPMETYGRRDAEIFLREIRAEAAGNP